MMENNDMKKCPYCAEMIQKEAVKCRYCGSIIGKKNIHPDLFSTPGYWCRVNDGKKIAGVCTGIAQQLDSPVLILPLRVFFILTTLFYGFGILLYIILWILMSPPEENRPFETPVDTSSNAPADSTLPKDGIVEVSPENPPKSENDSSPCQES